MNNETDLIDLFAKTLSFFKDQDKIFNLIFSPNTLKEIKVISQELLNVPQYLISFRAELDEKKSELESTKHKCDTLESQIKGLKRKVFLLEHEIYELKN